MKIRRAVRIVLMLAGLFSALMYALALLSGETP